MASPNDPAAYGRAKLLTLRARWNGAEGAALRRFGHDAALWPDTPFEALLGLSASSMGPREAGGPPDYATGLFGLEATNIPRLAGDTTVTRLLGRHGPTTVDGYLGDLDAQVVTGLLNYRRHAATALRGLPAHVQPQTEGSSYHLRVAVAAYSAGPGITRAVLGEYGDRLVGVDDDQRWRVLGDAISRETRATVRGYEVRGKWKMAHLIVRAEQRIESGLALAQATGGDTAWFAAWADAHPELVNHLVAWGFGTGNPPPRTGGDLGGLVAPALLALAFGAGAWWCAT